MQKKLNPTRGQAFISLRNNNNCNIKQLQEEDDNLKNKGRKCYNEIATNKFTLYNNTTQLSPKFTTFELYCAKIASIKYRSHTLRIIIFRKKKRSNSLIENIYEYHIKKKK